MTDQEVRATLRRLLQLWEEGGQELCEAVLEAGRQGVDLRELWQHAREQQAA